jgi:hypothetical protein
VELARALWQKEYLSREDLRQWVLADAIELLVVLLSWSEGDLVFEEGATPQPGRMVIPVPIALVLEEALRHISQRRQQSSPLRVAVSPDLVLDFAEEVDAGEGEREITPEQWRFLTGIDGRASLAEVAESLGMGASGAVRVASELLALAVLEVSGLERRPVSRPQAPVEEGTPRSTSGRLLRPSGQLPTTGSSGSMSAVPGRAPRPEG